LVVRTAGEDWGEVVEEEQLPPLRSGLAMACGGAMVDWHWLPRSSGDSGFLRRLMGEPAPPDVAAVPLDVAAVAAAAMDGNAAADAAVLSTINGALLALARGGMGVACCCLLLLLQVLLLLLLLLLMVLLLLMLLLLRCRALQLLLVLWLWL